MEGGTGELRYELPSGMGRMDILLTHRNRKYVIETKVNRADLGTTVDRALDQICEKYLATERVNEGYVVVFDLERTVGRLGVPEKRMVEGKVVSILVIGIGR